MALIVCLVDHVKAVVVAELVEPGNIRVVAGADCVEVVCFDHAQIQKGLVHAADSARDRIRLMAVNAPEGYGSPVQGQDAVLYLHP